MDGQRPEADQRAFFDAAFERAERALGVGEVIRRSYEIGGRRFRLLFAGDRLVSLLTPALSHLAVSDDAEVDGEITVWDSESTGVSMVDPPCSKREFSTRGDLFGFDSRRYRAAFHWIESSVNVFDRESRRGAYWIESARLLPYWVKASPLRSLLHWWAEVQGFQLLHAAAVGTDEGAVLITGKGGVGKSTTALVSLLHGLRYLADDYLVVSLEPEPRVHSLYSTAKLAPEQLARFPKLLPCVTNRAALDREKAVLALAERFADCLVRDLPLLAAVTPVIERRDDTVFRSAARDVVARSATFTTLEQLPYAGDYTHRFVERLSRSVPCYELALGRDLARVPEAILGFIADKPWRRAPEAASEPELVGGDLPLVSVVIPTYNGAKFLPEAVQSVLDQGYPSLQIIVVNDGSTDDTDVVVSRLPVSVRYIKHDISKGPAEARNRGIRDAIGEYLAFLDVDDLWPKNQLPRLVTHLVQHPGLDVVHGYGHLMRLDAETRRYEFQGSPREAFLFYIGAGVYHRRVFERVGLFDPELRFGEDADWYNRAYELGRAVERLEEVTLHVRRHDQNMTRGKSLVELNMLKVFKLALDRKRAREALEVKAQPATSEPGQP